METMDLESGERFDVMRADCLAREIIDRIADKWTLLVIHALGEEKTLRFSQLRERVEGVSQKMLTQTLRQLERDGLVDRQVFAVVPPRVEYTLTPLGYSLMDIACGICLWVEDHTVEIEGARQRFADRRASDQA